MCGFVGWVRFDGQGVSSTVLEHMADALAHRGPDGKGAFLKGSVGFSHRRLAIIDLSSGQQPMTREGCTIAFNGEIYNFVEVRQELRGRGHPFSTQSDTEVILRAYLEWGDDLVSHLRGMFAFLIHDARDQTLLAARDHLGVKPLYFRVDDREMVLASEIKAILRHPGVRAEPDWASFHDYVTLQFVLADRTLFRGIRKLEPGRIMKVDLRTGAHNVSKYWEPSFQVDRFHTDEYFTVELRRLLEESVHLQLRSDVPVGAHLSGGLDSSTLATLAARELSELVAFHGRFREGPEFDESVFARRVATEGRMRLVEIVPTAEDFVELLPRLVYHMDEPTAGPGLFPQYIVARRAAGEVKVVLGGQGGDEVFGGYARYLVAYLEQALKGAIMESTEEGEHIVSLTSIVPHLAVLKQYSPMLRRFWSNGLFEPMDRRYFDLIDRSEGSLSMYSEDFRAGFDRESVFTRFQKLFNHPDTLSYLNKMTHFDIMANLPALLHVEDRVSMAVSLESRVPLVDHRVVELIASMPPAMKFKGGQPKHIFRRAIKDLLPPDILDRKDKMGFPVPLHLWMRGDARDFMSDVLLGKTARERGLLSLPSLERSLGEEAAFSRRLWGAINLELWFQQFIDQPQPSPPSSDLDEPCPSASEDSTSNASN